jgi:hypothetical protein
MQKGAGMNPPATVRVTDPQGVHGTIDTAAWPLDGSRAEVLVSLESGQQVPVPVQALTRQEEGRYSVLIIVSGTWEFFDDDDFTGTKMATLGPGLYPRVTEKGLKDNSLSSVRLVSPTARAAEGRRPR